MDLDYMIEGTLKKAGYEWRLSNPKGDALGQAMARTILSGHQQNFIAAFVSGADLADKELADKELAEKALADKARALAEKAPAEKVSKLPRK